MYYASLITIADPLRVGNKAANLSTLHANGIPVPVGFAVTCDGLQLLLTESALDATIDAYLNFSADTPRAERQQQYTHICEQVMAAPLPQVLREDITPPLLAMLQNAPYGLAVRTSGVQEDTGDVGFAGTWWQQHGSSVVTTAVQRECVGLGDLGLKKVLGCQG